MDKINVAWFNLFHQLQKKDLIYKFYRDTCADSLEQN